MLKIKKTKVKLGGAMFAALLFCVSYIGISFYSVPEQVHAAGTETRTLADIKYMQEMNTYICHNSRNISDEITLEDIRDGKKYRVKSSPDSACWMLDNLALDLTHPGIASVKNSDNITSDYPAKALLDKLDTPHTNPWDGDNRVAEFSKAPSVIDSSYPGDGKGYQANYGYYYSWCAATAGTCLVKNVPVPAGEMATGSICPKGWRLPDQNQFKSIASNIEDYNFDLLGGVANSAGLKYAGSQGAYWSRVSAVSGDAAIIFKTANNGWSDANDFYWRYHGATIRCIADTTTLESEDLSNSRTSASDSIAVKVANTLSIDAVSGMEEEVDSTSVANGAITATIAANTNYKVLLSAEKTSLTSTNSANDAEIPASTNVAAGTNAWGIRNSDNSTYSAITTEEKEYHNTTAPSTNPAIPGTVHTFNIGISVSPSLPADTYSTEVTITAAAA